MTKADIVERVARATGLTRIETEAIVNGTISTIKDALEQGERIEIRGFGTFQVKHRAARKARNPRTNETVDVPARYVPAFKPSREFQQAVHNAQQDAA